MKSLSLDIFFDRLIESPRNWTMDAVGKIGLNGPKGMEVCPRLWVARDGAATLLEFPVIEIYLAADNKPGHDPELRKRLLEACGLA